MAKAILWGGNEDGGAPPSADTLELRDTRTAQAYTATIRSEGPEGDTYVRAMDLRAVKRAMHAIERAVCGAYFDSFARTSREACAALR